MPMLAVVALAAGATAGAVAIGGLALATAVTYVGIGMSVVGAVTGNKNFMKVGGIMGLAGGAMSLANIGTAVAGESGALGALADAGPIMDGESLATNAAWADEAAEVGRNVTAESFTTMGEGGIPGSAGAGSSALTSGAPVAPASGGTGLLNATPANPTGAYTPPEVPGAVDNAMTATTSPSLPSSVPSIPGAPAAQPAATQPATGDKKAWWASLPETTKNEIIKGGLAGAGKFFEGWSASEKAEWEQDRVAEQQRNLNAQPQVMRYKAPTGMGLLNATPKKVGG